MNMRLDKFLSGMGITSRRNTEKLLKRGTVTVNGRVVMEPGMRIETTHDLVLYKGKPVRTPRLVYVLLNKPKGIISTALDEKGRKNVVDLVKSKERLFPVGRLDKDTTGLILLTNDGELANTLTHPRYHVTKKYELVVSGVVTRTQIEKFQRGVLLEEGMTASCHLKVISSDKNTTILQAQLYEGKKRQIRRMCEVLGMDLVSLKRIQIGPLHIGKLKEGEFRPLTLKEIRLLQGETKSLS